jgi:recombination protein RecR
LGCPASARKSVDPVYEGIVQDLIDELGKLPNVGPKSAQRIAFHLLAADAADVRRLAQVLLEVKDKVRFCVICGNVAEEDECRICRDPRRDLSVICVVEESKDVVAVEKTREFRGRYHVLGGAISPIEGIGPDDLRVRELMTRLADGTVTELILATDPNLEGEATATYLARLVKPMGLRVTRLASGLPVGGDLEYADEITLGRAFEGRRQLDV